MINVQNGSTELDAHGKGDLSDCDREPIHHIGSIQPCGFLIALSADWRITHVSENVSEHLGRTVDSLLGGSFPKIFGARVLHTILSRLTLLHDADAIERAYSVSLLDGHAPFDLTVHRTRQAILIEAEPSRPPNELTTGAMVRSMLARIQGSDVALQKAARLVQVLTGFDRVMIYRFQPDGSGEVIAEHTRPGVESFLGLHYPANDIPRQARALLVRNPLRLLTDVSADPSVIRGELSAAYAPLDLSMSVLRAHSPIHIEYLSNMGVGATMTVSLLRDGKLWGLMACHHMTARHVGAEIRITTQLFGQILSLFIEKHERDELTRYQARTREVHDRLVATVVKAGSLGKDMHGLGEHMTELVPCDGIGVYVRGEIMLKGTTPSREEFRGLLGFLDDNESNGILALDKLSDAYPPAETFIDGAAGILAIPLSRRPRDYVVFFRREQASSVMWAGKPGKLTVKGPDGPRITPRKSFEAWREIVRGRSAAWTREQLAAADALRVTLLEVVLHLADVMERDTSAATEKQELLVRGLDHRVRNILGLIRGLISQSRVSAVDLDTFATVLGDRVLALARTHEQMTARNWEPSPIAALIQTETAAFADLDTFRVNASGPAVLLCPQAFSAVALIMHELMTNAAKHGALGEQQGRVSIEWALDDAGDLSIDWKESGGQPVKRPTRQGFGTTIIERTIPHELGGQSSITYEASGVRAHFRVPSRHVVVPAAGTVAPGDTRAAAPAATSPPGRLSGTVLIVEDSIFIALEAEDMLLALGASRVIIAGNVPDALRLIDAEKPSFALLDVNLGAEMSWPVAVRLRAMGIPLLFATGYGAMIDYPPAHRAAPKIMKPYTSVSLSHGVSLAVH